MNLSRTRRLLAVVATAAALVGLGATTASAAGWQMLDINGDRWNETAVLDADSDGNFEQIWIDRNQDGRYDLSAFDADDNRVKEWLHVLSGPGQVWAHDSGSYWLRYVDMDGNGRYEQLQLDGNRDGTIDYLAVDTNRDGTADVWQAFTQAPVPQRTQAQQTQDMMTQHIVTMGQLNIYRGRL